MTTSAVRFINNDIQITENGIDLISVHPFTHINFADVQELSIENGYLIKNRIPVRVIGSIVLIGALYLSIRYVPQLSHFFENGVVVSLLLLWRLAPLALIIGV